MKQEIKDKIRQMAEEDQYSLTTHEMISYKRGAEAVMQRLDIDLAKAYVILTNWNFNLMNTQEAKKEILNAITLKNEALRQPPVISSVCDNCGSKNLARKDDGTVYACNDCKEC